MKRILAIDFGAKRVGLAWTDPLQISINPLPAIDAEQFENSIKPYLESSEVTDVVFGMPNHTDGTITELGRKIESIIIRLKKRYLHTNFHTIDESYTSKEAVQLMIKLGIKKKERRNKKKVDSVSAVLILKNFLQRI